MSTSSRMSKSLSRDSQHLFLGGSTEPMLRNSVHITVSDSGIAESLNASEEGAETTTETASSDAAEESSNAPVYSEIKRRDKPSKEVRQKILKITQKSLNFCENCICKSQNYTCKSQNYTCKS